MSSETTNNLTLTAHCLCKAYTFETEIARSSLPLKATTCHCTSCRRVSGAMYTSCTLWPGDQAVIQQSSLQRYVFTKAVTILFCSICSSSLFWEIHSDGPDNAIEYKVFTGVLKNHDVPNLVQFTDNMFLGDTLDGGASAWLQKPNQSGVPAKGWVGHREENQEIHENWPVPETHAKTTLDEVRFRCHCKGVDFVLRNAGSEYKEKDDSELPWFVRPTRKCIASFDACDSCRLQSGVDVFHWTFSFLRCIAFPATSETPQRDFPALSKDLLKAVSVQGKDRDPRLGTLACYASSSDVQRLFCSRCAACVFYCVDTRPDVVDVAMGLLDAPSGARVEEFVTWAYDKEISWRNDMVGGWREGHIEAIEAEVKAWQGK